MPGMANQVLYIQIVKFVFHLKRLFVVFSVIECFIDFVLDIGDYRTPNHITTGLCPMVDFECRTRLGQPNKHNSKAAGILFRAILTIGATNYG